MAYIFTDNSWTDVWYRTWWMNHHWRHKNRKYLPKRCAGFRHFGEVNYSYPRRVRAVTRLRLTSTSAAGFEIWRARIKPTDSSAATQISVTPFSFKSGVLNKRPRTFSSRMPQTILSHNKHKSDSKSPYSLWRGHVGLLNTSRKFRFHVDCANWICIYSQWYFLHGEQCLAILSSSCHIILILGCYSPTCIYMLRSRASNVEKSSAVNSD